MSTFPVSDALSALSLSATFRDLVRSDQAYWGNFGKMNSHLYRKALFTSMSTSGLDKEASLIVIFLFCVIKSQERVLKALDEGTDSMKAATWYPKVREFIATKVTQYVTMSKVNKKFPAVNIPGTMPGLDMMVYAMITPDKEKSLDTMFKRPTAAQLNLSPGMQAKAKDGYAYYWDHIVTGTKNASSTEEPKMREDYYKNSAGDAYNLITLDNNGRLVELPPKSVKDGYTEDELKAYLSSFKS